MSESFVIALATETLWTCLLIVGPVMMVGFVVGIFISFIQAIMQIQEATLAFVPKLFAMGFALIFFGHWMLQKLMSYTAKIFSDFSSVMGG